ncbi:hypothetical protein QJS66_03585 [Kocuria rhizophila]|nr:hypothetical protein QJS66_03585 [Kocuria rhizophila]
MILVVLALISVIGLGGVAASAHEQPDIAARWTSRRIPGRWRWPAGRPGDGLGHAQRRGRRRVRRRQTPRTRGHDDARARHRGPGRRDRGVLPTGPRGGHPRCTDHPGRSTRPGRTCSTARWSAGGPGCTVAAINKLTGVDVGHFMLAELQRRHRALRRRGQRGGVRQRGRGRPRVRLKLPPASPPWRGSRPSRSCAPRRVRQRRGRGQNPLPAGLPGVPDTQDPGGRDARQTYCPQLYHIAEVMTQNLHVDQGLASIPALVEIGGTFNGIDPGSIAFVTAPTHRTRRTPTGCSSRSSRPEKLFATLQQDVGVTGGTQGSSSRPRRRPPHRRRRTGGTRCRRAVERHALPRAPRGGPRPWCP